MRKLLAVVSVAGGIVLSVWLATDSSVRPNAWAICPVHVSQDCQKRLGVKAYETLRLPVLRTVLEDGGVEVVLPSADGKGAESLVGCSKVLDWASCKFETAATRPGIDEKWESGAFEAARSESAFVIPDCRDGEGRWDDAHKPVDCLAGGHLGLPDGGPRWAGCNVIPRALSTGGACLDAPTGTVFAGERLEDSLLP